MSKVHWKQDYFNNCFSSFWNSYKMRKRISFLNSCSHNMVKFLVQISKPVKLTDFWSIWCLSCVSFPISIFSCQTAVKKKDVYLAWAKFSSIHF